MAEKKIIEIVVPIGDAVKAIGDVQKEIQRLTESQKALEKEGKKGSDQYAANTVALKNYRGQLTQLVIETNNEVKAINNEISAYDKLQAEYSQTAKEAKNLAVEQQNAIKQSGANSKQAIEAGKRADEASKKALEMSNRLKAADSSVGQNQRRIGDYANELRGLSGSFGGVIDGATQMNVGFKLLSANPIMGAIQILVVVFGALSKVLGSNTEAGKKLSVIFAPLTALFNGLVKIVGDFVGVLADGAKWIADFAAKTLDFIPAIHDMNEASRESIRIEQEKQRLQRQGILDKADDAKAELRIAILKKQMAESDKYTAEQRLAFAREIDALEKKLAYDDAERARKNLINFLDRMKQQGKTQKQYTDEELKEFSDLQAAKFSEEQKYYDNTRKTAGKAATLQNEMRTNEETKHKESLKRKKKREEDFENGRLNEIRQYVSEQLGIINEQAANAEKALAPKDKTLVQKVTEGGAAILAASVTANNALVENEKQTAAQIADIENQKRQNKIDMAWAGVDAIASVSDAIGAIANRELENWAKANRGKAGFDEEYAKKKAKIERDAAIRAKALGVFSVGITTAQAVIGALAPPPVGAGPVAGIPLAVATGLAGAAQITAILAEPLPSENVSGGSSGSTEKTTVNQKFHSGGAIGGTGEVPITALGGESVMNVNTTQMFTPLLSSLNQLGGGKAITSGVGSTGTGTDMLAAAFSKALSQMKAPEIVWKDFETAAERQEKIKNNRLIQ